VRELTDGRGVDCVVEISGPGTIAMSLKALAVGGHVSLIGASLSPAGTMLDPLLLTGRGITLGSISVGSRTDFETMNRAIAMHRLRPVIDRTFPFAEAKEAYRHFEDRGHFGKVVITSRLSGSLSRHTSPPQQLTRRAVTPRGGLENLWRRPCEYRPVPVSHSAPRVVGPWAGLRPLISLRLRARLGPKLGPPAGLRVFVAVTTSLVVT